MFTYKNVDFVNGNPWVTSRVNILEHLGRPIEL